MKPVKAKPTLFTLAIASIDHQLEILDSVYRTQRTKLVQVREGLAAIPGLAGTLVRGKLLYQVCSECGQPKSASGSALCKTCSIKRQWSDGKRKATRGPHNTAAASAARKQKPDTQAAEPESNESKPAKLLTCMDCGDKFQFRAQVRQHLKREHPQEQLRLKCSVPDCPDRFSNTEKRKAHMQAVHAAEIKANGQDHSQTHSA